jgi:hypothetical protein
MEWHKAAGTVGGAIRDGWLMIGVTLLLFLLLEWGYRLVAGKSGPRATVMTPDHPYAGEAWYREFNEGPSGPNARRFLVDPYRLHRLSPMKTRYISVDSLGHRHTVNELRDSATALRVFLFGGSAMWGFTARDSFTIPSHLAAVLRERGFDNVEVRNLAETGYNSTQEATTMVMELASGRVPDVAVFYNGYNDMATAFKWGVPGRVYELELAQSRADAARRSFVPDVLSLSRHSRLLRRLLPAADVEDVPVVEKPTVCPAVAGYYRRVAQSMAGMGQAHGFEVIYLVQPVHHTTRKPLSSFEKSLRVEPAFQACTAAIDSAMSDWQGRNYFSAYQWLDQYQDGAFTDRNSHTTEAANRVIAERMADVVQDRLRLRLAKP